MPDHILSLPSTHYLFILKKYLQSQKTAELSYIKEKVRKRASGESFNFSEHLQGLIYALLSSQAVWKKSMTIYLISTRYFLNTTKKKSS